MNNFILRALASKPQSVIVLLGLILICPNLSMATHLVGGELTYVYQGTNASGQNEFEIHCYIYRDCSSNNTNGTGFDGTAAVAVYQGSTLITTVSGSLDFSSVTDIIPQNPNNCAFLPEDLCIERGEYVIDIALEPSQIPYTLVHQRCCRSPSITNLVIPQDQGFSLTTTIPGNLTLNNPNSTPIFNELPQAFACNNYPFQLDNSASDADGDSLSYTLCPIFLGGTPLTPIPVPPTGPPFTQVGWENGFNAANPLGPVAGLTINPITGVLSGTPNIAGKFALGVCVIEWRNGQQIGSILRDFTLDVVTCNIQSPGYESPEPCTGLTVEFNQLTNPSEAYTWDFGVDGATDDVSTSAEPNYTYDEPGIYNVSLYFETGTCADSLFFEVTAHDTWETDFDIVDLVCDDGGWSGNVVLDTSQWTSYINWNWSFGGNSMPAELANEHPGIVWFPQDEAISISLNSSAFNCVNNAQVELDLPSLPIAEFEVISEPCSGLEVTFENLSPESGPFSWDFGGGAGLPNDETDPVFTYPAYGTYLVTLTAGAGSECADIQTQEVIVLPANPFDSTWVIQPLALCEETGFMLLQYTGQGADSVSWNFPGVFSSNLPSVETDFPGPGVYMGSITLYSVYCDVEETWEIEATVPPALQGIDYLVPNIISANNDSKNDAFTVELTVPNGDPLSNLDPGQFYQYELSVFNRWGNQLFTTRQAGKGWRPSESVAEGSYYVIFKAHHVCDAEPFEYSGAVTVVR